eukprot:m.175193 g.175193  ORF g.175193 m.175193 type:complete len:52 (+) comp24398_c0_seq1:3328-3483(+)
MRRVACAAWAAVAVARASSAPTSRRQPYHLTTLKAHTTPHFADREGVDRIL